MFIQPNPLTGLQGAMQELGELCESVAMDAQATRSAVFSLISSHPDPQQLLQHFLAHMDASAKMRQDLLEKHAHLWQDYRDAMLAAASPKNTPP